MTIPKIEGSQRDFSAGELDVSMKRADDNPIMKAGCRQLSNWRIKNSKAVKNRPGRTVLFLENGRVEEVLMSPTNAFYLVFGNGYLRVYNAAGAQVFATTKKGDGVANIPWTTATAINVVYAIDKYSIYIAYADGAPNNVPQVLSWDGVSQTSTWTLTTYAETVYAGIQKRTLFYRISPPNITMQPNGLTGLTNVTFSAPVLTAGHVGTRMRYAGRQVYINTVVDSQHGTIIVQEPLPPPQIMNISGGVPSTVYNVGDVVLGSISGAKGIVIAIANPNMTVQLIPLASGIVTNFLITDTVVGPNGGTGMVGIGFGLSPGAITLWDDEVMNAYRGYPASVFFDQNRLGFCNFPSVPAGIGWSAIGNNTDLYVDAQPDNAIFELAPRKSRVLFVQPGAESSEFVFCDNGVYYIPITPSNPLIPGSVAFNLVSTDGCANVQPRGVQEVILWINAGLISVMGIVATGAYSRPYEVRNFSDNHAHLFDTPIAIAVPSTTSQFEERYAYVLNADGSIAVGKYVIENGQIKGAIGWLPWSGAGTVGWMAALNSDVLFSTSYAPNGIAAVGVVERLDADQYLDGAMAVNAAPTALAPPPGKGPLWWLAGGTVDLIDQATRMMGTYTIDADGNIVPQNNAGENLLLASLVAGQPWTATLEPFVPAADPGKSLGQRLKKRRVSMLAVYVIDSTGFLFERLFAGPLSASSPALGAVVNVRRVSAWNQGDDPTLPPPLRETVERWRPLGRAFDPRVAIVKDTPGPLEIPEIAIEVTI